MSTTIEDIERRWDTVTPAREYPVEHTYGPLYLDDDRSLRAYAAAPTDIAYLLDLVRKLEDCEEAVRAKLTECDREASLRGLSITGFPRLWFSSLSRAAGLELRSPLASMTGTGNEGSIPSAAALDSLSSPALAEMQFQLDACVSELEKHKRAHAWFVEHLSCYDGPQFRCGICLGSREDGHLHDCEWVKAKELRL